MWEFRVENQEDGDQMHVTGLNMTVKSTQDKEPTENLSKELEVDRAHVRKTSTGDNAKQEAEWC